MEEGVNGRVQGVPLLWGSAAVMADRHGAMARNSIVLFGGHGGFGYQRMLGGYGGSGDGKLI